MMKNEAQRDASSSIEKIFNVAQDAYFDHQHSTSLELFERYISLGGKREMEARIYISMCAFQCRMAHLGMSVLEKLHPTDPEDLFQHERLAGQLSKLMGDSKKATIHFREAIKHNAIGTPGYIYMGSHLIDIGEYEEAIEILGKALDLEGDLDEVHLNLAIAYRALRKYKDAFKHAESALEIDPNYRSAKMLQKDLKKVLALESSPK